MRIGYSRKEGRTLPPPSTDPMASVGYLIAAVVTTVIGLTGYGILLAKRLQEAREERRALKR